MHKRTSDVRNAGTHTARHPPRAAGCEPRARHGAEPRSGEV